jgi:hypothetical protein
VEQLQFVVDVEDNFEHVKHITGTLDFLASN